MFWGCSSLTNLNLSNFNADNITNMVSMYSECSSLTNLNLSNFNINNDTYRYAMFDYTNKLSNNDIITNDEQILREFNKRKLD